MINRLHVYFVVALDIHYVLYINVPTWCMNTDSYILYQRNHHLLNLNLRPTRYNKVTL